jgi:hypothetical protein
MELAGVIRTSERRQGSSGEMYANQRHILRSVKAAKVKIYIKRVDIKL